MNRLTKKLDNGMYVAPDISNTYEIKNKLGQLEDIMEYYHIETLEQLKQVLNFPFMVENKEYNMYLGNISCFTDNKGKPKVVKPQYVSLAIEMVDRIFQEALSEFKEELKNE